MTDQHENEAIDEATQALLQRYGHDARLFSKLRERVRRGAAESENRLTGKVEPPGPADVLVSNGPDRAAHIERGRAAIRAGEIAVVILAGGMATRFGGVVKAAVEVLDGHHFLELKLRDIARTAEREGTTIPVAIMTSFATHDAILELAAPYSTARMPVQCFPQFISLRLAPDGSLFREADGSVSPYAPGHGDLTFALRRSGILASLRERGVRTLFMSNVDNLGATLEPEVLGAHLAMGKAITAEVVRKEPGDKGGAPARVGGVLQVIESFRFPAEFDEDVIPIFSINSFVLDAAAIDRDFDLTFFFVKKKVEGREAIQFERLVGELTGHLPTAFIEVDRAGPRGRFQPVKDPDELARRRPAIREILVARGVL